MLIELMVGFLGEILVECVWYGTYNLMEFILEWLYKGWNKTLKKVLCVLMGIALWILIGLLVIRMLEIIL